MQKTTINTLSKILGVVALCCGAAIAGASSTTRVDRVLAAGAHNKNSSVFAMQVLEPAMGDASQASVVGGSLDAHFAPLPSHNARPRTAAFWLKLVARDAVLPAGVATFNILQDRGLSTQVFVVNASAATPLKLATAVSGFMGVHTEVFLLPNGLQAGQSLYVHVNNAAAAGDINFSTATLAATLADASEHTRMIAIAFGALLAMALAALLIWFVLAEKLLLLYALLFSLQAIYIAYFSGEGFDWPLLSSAASLQSYAWNVPAGLLGAVGCLFVREIAELQRFSPRVYKVFGWLAIAYVIVTLGNFAEGIGLGGVVAMLGNLLFIGTGVFTLIVAFLAWRRNNRAAGWFLIAWGLLETFTIVTAMSLLFGATETSPTLLYYGLPFSMVGAAVLIALGVADRLRAQRLALSDAERRAQIDPLTGVLNRRSLADRLEAACVRAQARGLPIALLFIDLDHFKQINDTYSHAAGDACLRAIIAPIQSELRQSDVIGRYGGEEFVVILSSADIASAQPIAERIRERVAALHLPGFGEPIRVTCSIGIASSDLLGIWGEQLITHADQAVYEAKRSGRNRVQIATPVSAPINAPVAA